MVERSKDTSCNAGKEDGSLSRRAAEEQFTIESTMMLRSGMQRGYVTRVATVVSVVLASDSATADGEVSRDRSIPIRTREDTVGHLHTARRFIISQTSVALRVASGILTKKDNFASLESYRNIHANVPSVDGMLPSPPLGPLASIETVRRGIPRFSDVGWKREKTDKNISISWLDVRGMGASD